MAVIRQISTLDFCRYLIIPAVVSLVYFPTFSGEFILDDKPLVEKNPYIKETHSFGSYLGQEDGVSEKSNENYHTGYYRPLLNVSYWIDYKLWGMSAPGFRTTNLILHLLACFLLLKIMDLLLSDRQAALLSTLLFALHPVNTEAVSWITSRNNILVTLFALASLYFYIRSWEIESYKVRILAILFFIGAIFSKEFGLMILPLFFLSHRLVFQGRPDGLREITGYLPFVLISILYFVLRKSATDSLLTPSDMGNLWQRVFFTPYLIMLNLKLIFFPYDLHSFIVHYPNEYLSWQAIGGFSCLGLFGFLLWRVRKDKIVSFALFSFLIALFPVINIVPTWAVTLISMRWLYFPMAFLALALPIYVGKAAKINRSLTLTFLGVLLIYLGGYSYVLNKELWHDEDSFFVQEIMHFNNNYYAHGYAVKLLDRKKYAEAERYFQIAIRQYPDQAKGFINYSALLIETGRPYDAFLCLDKAKALKMNFIEKGRWHNNMGMAYFKLKNYDQALKSFLEAVEFTQNDPQIWANLGGAYGAIGDYTNSVSVLKKGLEMVPDSLHLKKNLAVTYVLMEDYEKAIATLEKIPAHELEKNRAIRELLRQSRNNLLKRH